MIGRLTGKVALKAADHALIDVGGRRERLKHCVDAAIATADEAFGAPHMNLTFHRRALVPIPTDDEGQPLRSIWRRLREPSSPRFGHAATTLHGALDPDVILLVTGRRTGRIHGYASPPRHAHEPAYAVVPVTELRHGDLTLAHELGHCSALLHRQSSNGMRQDVMSVSSSRRSRKLNSR